MSGHAPPPSYRLLGSVLFLLLILTGVTVLSAGVDMGRFNIVVALSIAFAKSFLVLWFFMHLSQASTLVRGTFVLTVGFLAILIAFLFWDIAFR